MNIIYLSLNITLLYHIQYISVFRYSSNTDFTLYCKYTLYLIYPHRVNMFHFSSNFDLLPYSNFIYLITNLSFNFGVFSTYAFLRFWCFGIFSIYSYSIYLQCVSNIYLSPNIKFVDRILFISGFILSSICHYYLFIS